MEGGVTISTIGKVIVTDSSENKEGDLFVDFYNPVLQMCACARPFPSFWWVCKFLGD